MRGGCAKAPPPRIQAPPLPVLPLPPGLLSPRSPVKMFIRVTKRERGYFFFFFDPLSFPSISCWPCFLISSRDGT
jgi:hypothetical protein